MMRQFLGNEFTESHQLSNKLSRYLQKTCKSWTCFEFIQGATLPQICYPCISITHCAEILMWQTDLHTILVLPSSPFRCWNTSVTLALKSWRLVGGVRNMWCFTPQKVIRSVDLVAILLDVRVLRGNNFCSLSWTMMAQCAGALGTTKHLSQLHSVIDRRFDYSSGRASLVIYHLEISLTVEVAVKEVRPNDSVISINVAHITSFCCDCGS